MQPMVPPTDLTPRSQPIPGLAAPSAEALTPPEVNRMLIEVRAAMLLLALEGRSVARAVGVSGVKVAAMLR